MRTLQEKYNGIQEGKFSKENFLADARMQQPQLVTRFNGYDDAVQILKNKGMIVEAAKVTSKRYKGLKYEIQYEAPKGYKVVGVGELEKAIGSPKFYKTSEEARDRAESDIKDYLGEKETVKEARLTNKSLTDYRYKPTNEMDKYPYEQILRGIRVELETLGVQGTPTAEEYAKALAKVSKNLAKDSIFYTNQLAGVNPKVDLHDKMVDATAKNTVDTFNGMKKAALKEDHSKNPNDKYTVKTCDMEGTPWAVWEGKKKVKGFATKAEAKEYADKQNKKQGLSESVLKEGIKNLIKKVLSEEVIDVEDYNDEDEYDMYGDDEADDIPHPRGYEDQDEIDYDDENFSDPFIDGDLDEQKSEKELRAEWEKHQATSHPEDKMSYMEWRSEQGLDEEIDTEVGKRVTFTNTNDGNKYTGTLVQDLGNGRFTFRAKDGKVYGSEGFGSNWKIEFEASKKATPEIPSFKGTRDALDDLFESVSLKDIL